MKRTFKDLLLPLLLALFLAGCAGTASKESTGEYIDDSSITTQVMAKLVGDPGTSALKIAVETFRGEVQLSGFATAAQAKRAVELTREVKGVKRVINNIQIRG